MANWIRWTPRWYSKKKTETEVSKTSEGYMKRVVLAVVVSVVLAFLIQLAFFMISYEEHSPLSTLSQYSVYAGMFDHLLITSTFFTLIALMRLLSQDKVI